MERLTEAVQALCLYDNHEKECIADNELTFSAGKTLEITNSQGDWWWARDPESGREGQVARNYLLPPACLFQTIFTTQWIAEAPICRKDVPSHLSAHLIEGTMGMRIQIMDALGDDYWVGRVKDGDVGLVHASNVLLPSFAPALFLAKALCDQKGNRVGWVPFLKNDILAILRIQSDHVWQVRLQDGRVGLASTACFQTAESSMDQKSDFYLPTLHQLPLIYEARAMCNCTIPPFANGLSYRRNEIVQVLRISSEERWIAKSSSGLIGTIHSNNFSPLPILKVITAGYSPRSTNELALEKGGLLTLHKVISANWFKARSSSGEEGLLPANHVIILNK
ncbi:MAG: hypothetical protein DHS80DRAFT_28787 [Piptocephalis tieghemiana]|nr:MAG: hypothetical protein DHS80DRAFT_28787 [Piptocephalis tieghemiana]